jgi:hypothetical protein
VVDRHEASARELRRVLVLDPGRAELDRLIADDVREQLRGQRRVHAPVFDVVVARDRLGEHDAVGRDDLAARPRDELQELARVVRVVGEPLAVHELEVRQLGDEPDEQHHDDRADTADARVHRFA